MQRSVGVLNAVRVELILWHCRRSSARLQTGEVPRKVAAKPAERLVFKTTLVNDAWSRLAGVDYIFIDEISMIACHNTYYSSMYSAGIPVDSAQNQPLNFKIGNYLHKGLARLLIFEVFIICILIFFKFIKYIY